MTKTNGKLSRAGRQTPKPPPGPAVPLGPVPTVAKVMWGRTVEGNQVAVTFETPLGSHTYLFDPDPADMVADEIKRQATLARTGIVVPTK